jgi:hypothetical protein
LTARTYEQCSIHAEALLISRNRIELPEDLFGGINWGMTEMMGRLGGSVKAAGLGDGCTAFREDHRQSFDKLRRVAALDDATREVGVNAVAQLVLRSANAGCRVRRG